MKMTKAMVGTVLLVCTIGWVAAPVFADPPKPVTADEIAEMIAAAGDAEDFDGADLVYVLDEADVFVQDSGLATTEACQVIKILTNAGVRSRSVLRWEFDADTYRTTIKSVRIHRKDATIDEVDVSSHVTQSAPQHMIFWGNEQHVLSVPRLDIGDTLEIRTSKIGFNIAYLADSGSAAGGSGGPGEVDLIPPMAGHWYEVTLFQGRYPILQKRYSVHMPKDMPVQYEVYNGSLRSSLWFNGDYHSYTWTAEDVPAVKNEPHMVALDDCVPKLVMATLEDWHGKSRWFYEVNESQFDADDAIRAKVAELTDDLQTEDDKIAAVVHWVADNIRYNGTKQGGVCEGYTLHASTKTFRDRGGVCKDKAGIAITMLRVLGHEAYAALTMAGSRVERIPADQFNHTVTVIREKDGTFDVIDPTWVPNMRALWSSFEDQQGLVYGTPEGEDQTLSPHYTPEYNAREVRSTGEIGEDGTLSTRIVYDLHGAAGGRFRRAVNGMPVPDRLARFEDVLNIAPNARIESLDMIDPYDYSRDGFVNMEVVADGFAAGGDDTHMFRLPLMSHPLNGFFRATFLNSATTKDRKYGMHLWATRKIHYEETLRLPPGWEVADLPKSETLDSAGSSLSFEAESGDGTLSYRFTFSVKKGTLAAEDYADYKKAVDTMNKLSDTWIVCREAGGDAHVAGGQAGR